MQRTIRILLVTGAALIPLGISGANVQKVAAQECTSEGCVSSVGNGCNSCRSSRRLARNARTGDYCDPCSYGSRRQCNLRTTSRDFALNWTGKCGPIGRPARRGCPVAQKIKWCCDTKAYPDSGWAPPAHTPINRTDFVYRNYWPHAWYGNPGGGYGPGAPMVYQPTDTTQMGYGYAHVPVWRSNPHKIPPVPNPSNFHARFCPCGPRCSSCPVGCHTGCLHGGYVGTSCPNGQCQGTVLITNPAGAQPAAGFVRMDQFQHAAPQVRTTGLAVKAVQPVQAGQRIEPVHKQAKNIQPVSRAVPKAAPEAPKVQQSAGQPRPNQNTSVKSRPAGSSPSTRPANRRTAGRRRSQPRKSGGWFGLPSLSEIKF